MKYVRLIHLVVLLWVGNATKICSGRLAKAAKMETLNVKTFPTGEAAMGKSNGCRYFTKYVFLKISKKFTGKHLC